ncbi:hypothetical protein ACO0OE_001728 [Hanseniaspora uvarum]
MTAIPQEYLLDYTSLKNSPSVLPESHAQGFKHISPEYMHKTNRYTALIQGQHFVQVPEYTLETNNQKLTNFPIAYKTWGKLSPKKDNCIVVCHALTGSSDIQDWWGPLVGRNKLKSFDYSRYFIICLNSCGSPYGSLSPVTNPILNENGELIGDADFPLVTVRDDVAIHKLILEKVFGIPFINTCIGGSMGGMLALEYASLYGEDFVKKLVVLATSARHSAWCISWSEAQRQAIYSDPYFKNGRYDINEQPAQGLAAARMTALLTYRSRNSFEQRFSRREASDAAKKKVLEQEENATRVTSRRMSSDIEFKTVDVSAGSSSSSSTTTLENQNSNKREDKLFSAQSYLRYQGLKFVNRFDANCYVSITKKLDSHDISRPSYHNINKYEDYEQRYREDPDSIMEEVLKDFQMPTLIIGIESDGLFTFSEQQYLAKHIPYAELKIVKSLEGHDAFLLEFVEVNSYIRNFMNKFNRDMEDFHYDPLLDEEISKGVEIMDIKESMSGEAGDVTDW